MGRAHMTVVSITSIIYYYIAIESEFTITSDIPSLVCSHHVIILVSIK